MTRKESFVMMSWPLRYSHVNVSLRVDFSLYV